MFLAVPFLCEMEFWQLAKQENSNFSWSLVDHKWCRATEKYDTDMISIAPYGPFLKILH